MDFVTHGIEGGLLYALPVYVVYWMLGLLVPFALIMVWLVFAWGFIIGCAPDVYPWLTGLHDEQKGWALYTKYHLNKNPHGLEKLAAFHLHVAIVDPPFHKKPDGVSQEDWDANKDNIRNWWPRKWPLCIMHWVICILGLLVLVV